MEFICHNCISDSYLVGKSQKNKKKKKVCYECGEKENYGFSLERLSELVHQVFETHFEQTSPDPQGFDVYLARQGDWYQEGDLVEDILPDLLGVTEGVASLVQEQLADKHNFYGKDSFDMLQPYDNEARYIEKRVSTIQHLLSWNQFKQSLKTEVRFYNPDLNGFLTEIFGSLNQSYRNTGSTIRTLTPKDEFYRGRIAADNSEVKALLDDLPLSLGPPPKNASAGRMNPVGISTFYGALDQHTCIAELRAPVGSKVIIGRFSPTRELKLLDLSRLQRLYNFRGGSLFDSKYIAAISKANFLKELVKEISEPVMPQTKELDYLPTQVIAEFLSTSKNLGEVDSLDGIIYDSSQVDPAEPIPAQESEHHKNLLLFHKSSKLKNNSCPSSERADISYQSCEEDDITYYYYQEQVEEQEIEMEGFDLSASSDIELNLDSIEIHEVASVKYSSIKHDAVNLRAEEYRTNEDFSF